MFQQAKPLFLHCETPLHVGSGNNLGIVDLPIQRERHTDFPKVESSSLKGALREACEQAADGDTAAQVKIHVLFGYDEAGIPSANKKDIEKAFTSANNQKNNQKPDLTEFSGCLGFTDARLLLFPVKSIKGIFAWITCPYVLTRLKDDLALAGVTLPFAIPAENSRPQNSALILSNNQAVFEEYAFSLTENQETTDLAKWLKEKVFAGDDYLGNRIPTHLAVLSNEDFRDFVNFSTEVITRIKINNATGTVAKGALFSEELLPAESIMYSLVLASPEFSARQTKIFASAQDVMNCFESFITQGMSKRFQMGGDSTLGKGIMRTVLGVKA